MHDLLPHTALVEWLGDKACPVPGIKELCANIMFLMAGFDEKNLNQVKQINSNLSYLMYFILIDSYSSICGSYSSRNISKECSPLGTS